MLHSLALLLIALHVATALPSPPLATTVAPQRVFASTFDPASTWNDDEGVGHLSQWSRETKVEFLGALSDNNARDWTIVTGNEGGDLDSMVSAMAWAYHLSHYGTEPKKAIALLQTTMDGLDLRPENQLALHYARMASRHRDLLTIDELPVKPFDLWHRVNGLVLVDHNSPRTIWRNTTVLSIIDHHEDRNLSLSAEPRIIAQSASCSSLVAEAMLDALASRDSHAHTKPADPSISSKLHGALPIELVELLLRTIALDSGGLKAKSSFDVDLRSAERLLAKSSWRGRELREVMKTLSKDLSASKRALDSLSLRDLLRRDWKGDAVATQSSKYPTINLGFASIPVSMNDQILRLPEQTPPEWFSVERAYTAEVSADVSVVLTNYRDTLTDRKVHEIALVVAHGWGKRLGEKAADRLFLALKRGIEDAPELDVLEEWKRPDGKPLLPRRAVWRHFNDKAGRKLLRPVVERAAKEWSG